MRGCLVLLYQSGVRNGSPHRPIILLVAPITASKPLLIRYFQATAATPLPLLPWHLSVETREGAHARYGHGLTSFQ